MFLSVEKNYFNWTYSYAVAGTVAKGGAMVGGLPGNGGWIALGWTNGGVV